MKLQKFITSFFLIITLHSHAQDRKDLSVSLAGGILHTPYYANNRGRWFFEIDFDFYLAKRHILSVNHLSGGHRYYEYGYFAGSSTNPDRTNSKADYRTFCILYKFKIIVSEQLSLVPGIGVGLLTHTRGGGVNETGWTDLTFPVSLDLNLKLSEHWMLGIRSGLFIEPDFPIMALHLGPKLSFIIK